MMLSQLSSKHEPVGHSGGDTHARDVCPRMNLGGGNAGADSVTVQYI